ncbi:C40 family peptidase [Paenibacillus lutrae]|uniref:SH3 domain-containing protein n=1 Tax=Paenibacillus lutrae TaxID=2078573 RepID=A0A7X3JYK2_9BACL|nr:SH3 domain-containing C40 family peptidase [Paenibacillus lutrae]MVO99015.1 SH3 domain-containing protein [Paenibacillus lutrae]
MKRLSKLVLSLAVLGSSYSVAGAAFAETAPAVKSSTTSIIITTGTPYLKQEPVSGKGKIYGTVPKGTELKLLEETNRYFVKVNYKGQTGYISTLFFKKVSGGTTTKPESGSSSSSNITLAKKADNIIAFAKSLEGKVQYQYGKNDTNKLLFDCSSFTKYVFAKEGINLKWGARSQYKAATPISKSELRKGDLVFFSTNATYKYTDKVQKIGHVGLYMGNGKFIHNVNPKDDVVIGDMNASWQQKHFVAAARVLK